MTISRLEQAKCLLERAEGFAVTASAGAMEQAALCLEAVVALALPGVELRALSGQISRLRTLIEEAARHRLAWARLRAAGEAGYTAAGEPAPDLTACAVEVRG
jgi:hypothetical protein